MAFLLENAMNGTALVQDASNHPDLRFMTTRKTTSAVPLQELISPLPLRWSVSNNVSVSDDGKRGVGSSDDDWLYMSAVCYLYGLNLHLARRVAVGLINTNWGGTQIQDWSSSDALAQCDGGGGELGAATHLFNAMISPLMNMTIKGAIWYQGHSEPPRPPPQHNTREEKKPTDASGVTLAKAGESNGGAPIQYG